MTTLAIVPLVALYVGWLLKDLEPTSLFTRHDEDNR
jgi:hypothetical protein